MEPRSTSHTRDRYGRVVQTDYYREKPKRRGVKFLAAMLGIFALSAAFMGALLNFAISQNAKLNDRVDQLLTERIAPAAQQLSSEEVPLPSEVFDINEGQIETFEKQTSKNETLKKEESNYTSIPNTWNKRQEQKSVQTSEPEQTMEEPSSEETQVSETITQDNEGTAYVYY